MTFLFVFRPVFPVVNYFIDYEYISTVLCINKDKPELECNGKCHLMKEMAQTVDDEKQLNRDKKNFPVEFSVLFLSALDDYSLLKEDPVDHRIFNTYFNTYFRLNTSGVFRPPLFDVI